MAKKRENPYYSWEEIRRMVTERDSHNQTQAADAALAESMELKIEEGEKLLDCPNDDFDQSLIIKLKSDIIYLSREYSKSKLKKTA